MFPPLSIYFHFLGQKYPFPMARVLCRYLNWLTVYKNKLHLGGKDGKRRDCNTSPLKGVQVEWEKVMAAILFPHSFARASHSWSCQMGFHVAVGLAVTVRTLLFKWGWEINILNGKNFHNQQQKVRVFSLFCWCHWFQGLLDRGGYAENCIWLSKW